MPSLPLWLRRNSSQGLPSPTPWWLNPKMRVLQRVVPSQVRKLRPTHWAAQGQGRIGAQASWCPSQCSVLPPQACPSKHDRAGKVPSPKPDRGFSGGSWRTNVCLNQDGKWPLRAHPRWGIILWGQLCLVLKLRRPAWLKLCLSNTNWTHGHLSLAVNCLDVAQHISKQSEMFLSCALRSYWWESKKVWLSHKWQEEMLNNLTNPCFWIQWTTAIYHTTLFFK